MVDYNKIALLFALISLALAFDLAAIKPRFPQQFMATITNNEGYSGQSYYGRQPYPCLFDFVNKREKRGNEGGLVSRLQSVGAAGLYCWCYFNLSFWINFLASTGHFSQDLIILA
jgi:hypothetical protein